MEVHLVDGTYELFRQFFGQPPRSADDGAEIGAARGVVLSVMGMLADGATHVGVATDHVIESFRNGLWPGYKDGAGIDPALWSQFGVLESALQSLGVVVWPMVELEADDALASAASVAAGDPEVDRVIICTPDKDLAQCGGRRAGRPARPPERDDHRRGRGVGQVRGRPAVDTRLARPGRRFRRRLPRTGGVGPTVSIGGAGPLRKHRGRARRRRASGIRPSASRCGARPSWPTGSPPSATGPNCSGTWPPSGWTRPCSAGVEALRWRGPTGEFEAVCRHFRDPGTGRTGRRHRRPLVAPGQLTAAEDVVELGGHRGVELRVGAGLRGPVGAPADERGGMPEPVDLEVVVGHLGDQLGPQAAPS